MMYSLSLHLSVQQLLLNTFDISFVLLLHHILLLEVVLLSPLLTSLLSLRLLAHSLLVFLVFVKALIGVDDLPPFFPSVGSVHVRCGVVFIHLKRKGIYVVDLELLALGQ
jgi:hypothetical protein